MTVKEKHLQRTKFPQQQQLWIVWLEDNDHRGACNSCNKEAVRAQHQGENSWDPVAPGKMFFLLLVHRERQTRTNLLGGKIVLEKKKKDAWVDLGLSPLCSLMWGPGEDGFQTISDSCQKSSSQWAQSAPARPRSQWNKEQTQRIRTKVNKCQGNNNNASRENSQNKDSPTLHFCTNTSRPCLH